MTIRELVTKLGFDLDEKPLKAYQAGIKSVTEGVKGVAVASAAAAASMFAIAATTAHTGDEISKASQKLGIGTDELQKLRFAAHMADVSAEELGLSLNILNRNIGEARSGQKESIKNFAQLGASFDMNALKSGDMNQVLMSVADTFKNMPNGPQKAKIAMELFGRSGARLIPLLNEGSEGMKKFGDEAERLGIILDGEAIAKSIEFDDTLKSLTRVLIGLKNIVGVALLGPITKTMHAISEWVTANRELIATNIQSFFEGVADVLSSVMWFAIRTANAIQTLVKPLGGLGKAFKLAFAGFMLFKGAQVAIGIHQIAGSALIATKNLIAFGKTFMQMAKIGGLLNTISFMWTSAGNAAFVAQLKMVAVGIAIAAAIAGVLLIIEDIVGFFQGKDSVTGIIVEKFKELGPIILGHIKGFFVKFAEMASSAGTMLAEFLLNAIKTVVMNSPLGLLVSKGMQMAQGSGLFGASSPTAAPVMGGGNTSMNSTSVTAPITVNVPAGTDPAQVGNKARDGISNGLDNAIRSSSAGTRPALAY